MLKKILKMIFKKEIKEEIMPELDRKVINLLNKIDITQCFINRSIKKIKTNNTVKTDNGKSIKITVDIWINKVVIEYGYEHIIELPKSEHKKVYYHANELYDKIDAFLDAEEKRKFTKTLQADFLD
ncbi:hypothetical protein [Mucispirillum schaedleri]|uniref:hypothetical protein n=1 Tax=Mucispirillum schaedleri TaxID=248039 RepID=UPI001F57509C|nr:hypothetical protein [Mucispirillum schaedleri]